MKIKSRVCNARLKKLLLEKVPKLHKHPAVSISLTLENVIHERRLLARPLSSPRYGRRGRLHFYQGARELDIPTNTDWKC